MANIVEPRTFRILVVDDEVPVCVAIADYLMAYGLTVDTASGQQEAEALILATPYDLVLTDLRLADGRGREGLELAGFVRKHRPAARVVLLTAHGSRELDREARLQGVNQSLDKPLPLSQLAAELFRQLGMESGPHPFQQRHAR